MARTRTERLIVTRVTPEGTARRPDELIVEEPMTIQLDGTVVSTTMRTPGHDYELAAGFCFTEGLLAGAPVTGVRYCANGPASASEFNVVTVETGGRAPAPTPAARHDVVELRLVRQRPDRRRCSTGSTRCRRTTRSPTTVLASVPVRVLGGQGLFDTTGAVHAAAAFDARRRRAADP